MNSRSVLMMFAAVFATAIVFARETTSLDGEWKFRHGLENPCPGSGANHHGLENPCHGWRKVTVPHDWAIEGPFDAAQPGNTGKLPWKGKGEYRRSFMTSAALRDGARAYLEFDGVMARAKVKLNGRAVGGWDYGYMSFRLDVTEALREGENLLEVSADTTDHQSRWYPGAGIYRSVRLVVAARGEAVPGSVVVTVPELTATAAKVRVRYDKVGGGAADYTFSIDNPRRWDVDDPYLYEVDAGGEKVRYGIREAKFTADDGFHLNGRRVQLKGVDLHSDLGPLGMAFNRCAAKRQLMIMKDMGVNALRTSHNPPAPQMLELCDELGIVVWNECFDKWNGTCGVRPDEDLDEYLERNLRAFVRRDRNHPSVVCWSIGNEMRFNAGLTARRVKTLGDLVRAEDPTRQVAAGCDLFEDWETYASLDMTGWNYGRRYQTMRAKCPAMPLVYSESASAYSDNGFYSVPPAACRDDYSKGVYRTDSYDHTSAPWSDIPDIEFYRLERDGFVAGEFVWTGIDYLGEPCPYIQEARSSYFGIADLCGLPKDRFYLYRSHWRPEATTCHILPHWNWKAGTKLPVYVYTNGDEAELFLNGRSLGRRAKQEPPADYELDFEGMDVKQFKDFRENPYYRVCDKYRLRWLEVAYEPGELKAVCYRKGEKIGEAVVKTAGKVADYRVTLDPYSKAGDELLYYRIDAVDGEGNRCPLAMDTVSVSLEGEGEIVATANGDPRDCRAFGSTVRELYFGRAVAIVRPKGAELPRVRAKASVCELLVPKAMKLEYGRGEVAAAKLAAPVFTGWKDLGAPTDVADQAYHLEIAADGVKVAASGKAGRAYAMTTLDQLAKLAAGGTVPACTITDWPKLKWRGCMLDTARNYLPVDALRDVIDMHAKYKLNLFHWHFTEDNGWRLESKKYPELRSEKAFYDQFGDRGGTKVYTQEEFRDVVAYAAERGVTVMPEFDVPGHSLAFRRAFGFKTMHEPGAREIIKDLVEELASLTDPAVMPFIHLGGDEVWKDHEKCEEGAFDVWAKAVCDSGRRVVSWNPGQATTVDGRVEMIWSRRSHAGGGKPCLDARVCYIEEYDPFSLLSYATYTEPCHGVPPECRFGGIICGWHDNAAGKDGAVTIRNQSVMPSLVMFGNLLWSGGAGHHQELRGRLPELDDPLLAPAVDLERRVVAQRDLVLKGEGRPFPFLAQTDMRWRLSRPDGTVVAEDVPQATIFFHNVLRPHRPFVPETNGTIVVESWIRSPVEQDTGAWIGFTAFDRDHGRARSSPLPKNGEWSIFGATAELNGEKLQPPEWDYPGAERGPDTLVYGMSALTDRAYGNADYNTRPPSRIHLKAGWNHVKLTVPYFAKQPVMYNWVATFIPMLGTTEHPREVPGLEYSSQPR